MPAWIRVRIPGVGTYSQREDVPLHDDAVLIEGVDGLGPDGRVLPDIPEEPLEAAAGTAAESTAPDAAPSEPAAPGETAAGAATKPGDDQAGTTGKSTSKE